MFLSICRIRDNRSREGRNFFRGGVKEANVMLLVIVYHEKYNIHKVGKKGFTDCYVQFN